MTVLGPLKAVDAMVVEWCNIRDIRIKSAWVDVGGTTLLAEVCNRTRLTQSMPWISTPIFLFEQNSPRIHLNITL